ncbi:MAG: hypothetical protein RL071_3258 [Pseudomonadota bacterium]
MTRLLLDPRNGPAWDLPAPAAPPRTYVVASLPRSGSTLLCNLLWDCGAAGAPKEYLNPMQLRDWELRLGAPAARLRNALLVGPAVGALAGRWGWGPARVQAHLARVRARRSQGGWFGLKLHLHHLRRWAGPAPLEGLLGPVRVLRIQRGDRLGQALSWARALQTNQWAAWQRPLLPPVYRRAQIDALLRRIDEDEAEWDRRLAGRPVHLLRYEALTADPAAALRACLAALDHPDPAAVPVPPPAHPRQADATSAAWRARYLEGR